MPLRAPSELSDSLHIYIFLSSFDDGFDEDDDVLPPLLPPNASSYSPDVFCC
jgi:hypothetical protein